MSDVITVQNLTKKFTLRKRKSGFLGSIRALFRGEKNEILAVDDVSFTIRRGELTGYLGPNGAGKSTTIKMLTGILQPTSGRIHVNGIDPGKSRKTLTRQIGVVFGQKTQLWWDLPVEESFDLLRTIYKIPKNEYKKRMELFFDLMHINEFMSQQTRMLSLGQRMRADLAASLLHNPPVLFLDEPTIGLDILTRDAIREFIKTLNRSEKTTIILTTHDMQDVEYLADRLILLDHGRIQYDGGLRDFTTRYSTERILTVHLETPCDDVFLTAAGYTIDRKHSPRHYDVRMAADASMNPLLDALNRAGCRIREISVRKQDLSDTLKLLYRGRTNLEL